MKQLVYGMRFIGNAAPKDSEDPSVITVKANGHSTLLGTIEGTGG